MTVTDRDIAARRFLAINGFAPEDAAPLAQDASFRRYFRVRGGAVLMDSPPPDQVRPFRRIAAHLASLGLSVPHVFAVDEANGFILEQDLGDAMFPAVMTAANMETMFLGAVEALIVMQRAAPPPDLPRWDPPAMIAATSDSLFHWWWPAMFGGPAPDEARQDITQALTQILEPVRTGPIVFTHRDYFAGNLLWLPDRSGPRRAGIIDFQSAALGHPAYDLVSLLQDARRDIPAAIQERAIVHYLAARPDYDPETFQNAYDACAAQRHLRVSCQWVRLARRDHRPQYLQHGPRTWALLNRALHRPANAPLAAALDRWIPLERRANPPETTP